ncbi:GLPGLI family protein [Tenacibaculum sp. KUL118]|nr:GLPGLI family protein [Tenacibaculum sp. KUL118]
MMKKIIFLSLLLLNVTSFIGQNKEGIITYRKENKQRMFSKDKDNSNINPKRLKRFREIEEEMIALTKELRFDLMFKEGKANFKHRDLMEVEGQRGFGMAIGPNATGKYFYQGKDVFWNVNAFGEDFIVLKDKLNWVLTSEKKKIGKYDCNKAVLDRKDKSGKKHIIAWYCPSINVPYGPIGYSGLPGLIMELDINGAIQYFVSNIEYKKIKKDIVKPRKGIEVTVKEFNNIAKGAMSDFHKNKGY